MINGIKLAPSILSADLAHLAEQVREVEAAGADCIHVDVMDGRFVPPITFGAPLVAALRRVTRLPLDIHLMIEEPERHVHDFIDAGGDIINVHVEACRHLHRVASEVRRRGARAGVCLNPATPTAAVEEGLAYVDQVMVMAVNPGWSGQPFIEGVLPKVRRLRRLIDEMRLAVEIEVDGGISPETAPLAISAGACVLVAASSVFNERASVTENMERLKESIARASER